MSNNSFGTALQVQNPLIAQSFNGALTTANPSAFYRVDLIGPSTAHFSVTGMTGNVELSLFDLRAGTNPIAISNNPARLSEAIVSQNLAAGTYYIRVDLNPEDTSANFSLNVSARTTADLSNIFWRNTPAKGLKMWEMDGVNVRVDLNYGIPLGPEWQAQLFADLNGDGDDDIVWRNMTNGDLVFWIMDGSRIKDTGYFSGVPLDFEVQKVGDLNLDRRADIVWKHRTEGTVSLWLMDPTGTNYEDFNYFTDFPLHPWHIQQMADFNGDAQQDLIFRHDDGTVAIWLMAGKTIKESAFAGQFDSNWKIQFSGDLNGDGNGDVIWRNTADGSIRFWLMDGTRVMQSVDSAGLLDWNIKAVADINGDGRVDLIWQNRQNFQPGAWITNPDGVSFGSQGGFLLNGSEVGALPAGWLVMDASDFSNDKRADLVLRNEVTQRVAIWQLNGRTIEALKIHNDQGGSLAADWKVNGILHRNLKGGESSISGIRPANAFDIGILDTRDKPGVYRDGVSKSNPDIYKFTFEGRSRMIAMNITGPAKDNATIKLYRAGANGSLGAEVPFTPMMMLDGGTYYIQLSTTKAGFFDYTLTLEAIPDLVNPKPTGTPLTILSPTRRMGQNFPTVDVGVTNPNNRNIKVNYSLTNTELSAASNFRVRFNLLNVSNTTTTEVISRRRLDVVSTGSSDTTLLSGGTEAGLGQDVFVTGAISQNQTFTREVTLRLPPASDSFWSMANEKVYLLEMQVDPLNELVERQDKKVKGEQDNLLTPPRGGEGPFSVNVINLLFPDLITKGIDSNLGTRNLNSTFTVNFSIQNIGQRGTPADARIPMQFFLSYDNAYDSSDLELFKPDGSFPDDIAPIDAGASVSRSVTLRLPSFAESSSFWSPNVVGKNNQQFYIVMVTNNPADAEFAELTPFNNYNRDANIRNNSTGIDAASIRLNIPAR